MLELAHSYFLPKLAQGLYRPSREKERERETKFYGFSIIIIIVIIMCIEGIFVFKNILIFKIIMFIKE